MRPLDEAQQTLDAAARELPSPELTRRMAEGLGLASSVVVAAAAHAACETKAAGMSAKAASVLARHALSMSVVAVAVAGAVTVGLWAKQHGTSSAASARIGTPMRETVAPLIVPLPPPPPPALAKDEWPPTSSRTSAGSRRAALNHRHSKAPAAGADSNGDFRAEIALVDTIRTEILAGNDARALSLLQTYDDSYRTGMFRLETATLRIEVLARLGETKRARALAARFLASHPDSVLVARVERATGLSPR